MAVLCLRRALALESAAVSGTVALPASGGREYNLIAHDGKHGQWRHWANGVLAPSRTKPGEMLQGDSRSFLKRTSLAVSSYPIALCA
jgi:hypothetical protein